MEHRYPHKEKMFPPSLLARVFFQRLTLKKVTWVKTTTELGSSYATSQEFQIDGAIEPIADTLSIIGLGGQQDLATAIGYFRLRYFVEGQEITVDPNDILVTEDGVDSWRVLGTRRTFVDRDSGYSVCILQKVSAT